MRIARAILATSIILARIPWQIIRDILWIEKVARIMDRAAKTIQQRERQKQMAEKQLTTAAIIRLFNAIAGDDSIEPNEDDWKVAQEIRDIVLTAGDSKRGIILLHLVACRIAVYREKCIQAYKIAERGVK